MPRPGRQAFTIGPYVTGDPDAGIRNYNMSDSPLNYSSVDYDFVGLQVHASGELWSATNVDIRSAMMQRYGAGDPALQKSCANGETPVTACPGNRRWVQLVFDSFLLMAIATTSHGRRERRAARRRPDPVRRRQPGPALERVRQARAGAGGLEQRPHDADPVPSFLSPFANEATVKLPAGRRE